MGRAPKPHGGHIRRSDAQFREFIDAASEGFLIVEEDGRITYANAKAARLFGYERSDILGLGIESLIPMRFRGVHEKHRLEYREDPAPRSFCRAVEIFGLRRDGTEFSAEVSLTPLGDRDVGWVAVSVVDVTRRKRVELERQLHSAELERSNHELDLFASIVSHDLHEPLRAVSSYLQLLRNRLGERLGPKEAEFLGYALEGAERMRALTVSLLEYARVGARGKPFAATDLRQACSTAVSNLSLAVEESGATIDVDALPMVEADGHQMTELLQNLLANAIKFHGESPPKIHVGAERQEDHWRVRVEDKGIGIPLKAHERVFQIFQQLGPRSERSGAGIGLSICKRIVERHGGTIWVESEPGRGSTFFFTIPAGKDE